MLALSQFDILLDYRVAVRLEFVTIGDRILRAVLIEEYSLIGFVPLLIRQTSLVIVLEDSHGHFRQIEALEGPFS